MGTRLWGALGTSDPVPHLVGSAESQWDTPGGFPAPSQPGPHSEHLFQLQQCGSMIILALYLEKYFSHQTHWEEASQRRDYSK